MFPTADGEMFAPAPPLTTAARRAHRGASQNENYREPVRAGLAYSFKAMSRNCLAAIKH